MKFIHSNNSLQTLTVCAASLALLLGCAAQQSQPVPSPDVDQKQKTTSASQNDTEQKIIINDDLTASELPEVALG